jgi:hypothetical protein
VARPSPPDFGKVVLRHRVAKEDLVNRMWIGVFVFGAVFLISVTFVFDARPGPPRAVYYFLWLLFVLAAVRSISARYFSTPMVLLERGIFLPAYRPAHWVFLRRRAIAFSDIRRVKLDASPFRSGTHLFETARGPVRCLKAFFPPPKRFAEELKRQAPDIEVELIDRKGKVRRYAPVVTKRPRKPSTNGEGTHAK